MQKKVTVREIRLGEVCHFPNFLKYGFACLKMNAYPHASACVHACAHTHTHTHTHTKQTLKPISAHCSPGRLGISVEHVGEGCLPAH